MVLGEADFTGITRGNAIPIIFESGQTSTTITVPIANDGRVEGDEQFMGQIVSGGGIDNIVIFAPTANVTILDDDGKHNSYYNSKKRLLCLCL